MAQNLTLRLLPSGAPACSQSFPKCALAGAMVGASAHLRSQMEVYCTRGRRSLETLLVPD